jgi:hypothetical protein
MEDPTLNPDDFTAAALDRKNADWDKLYENYNAAVDWPTVSFYKELFQKYPDAKVILTVRSADSWYKSVKNTVHLASIQLKGMTEDHPIYPFARMCRTVTFNGELSDPEKFKDEEAIKKLYLDHIEDVKKTIPAEQLYIMELGSGWEGLCTFLGKDVPKEPYPNSNSTHEFQKKITTMSENLGTSTELNKAAASV